MRKKKKTKREKRPCVPGRSVCVRIQMDGHVVHMGGWVDGWMGGWVDGCAGMQAGVEVYCIVTIVGGYGWKFETQLGTI